MNVAPAGGANAKAYKNTRFQASRRLPNPFAEMPMRVDSRRRVGTLFRGLRRRAAASGGCPGRRVCGRVRVRQRPRSVLPNKRQRMSWHDAVR